MRKFSAAMPLPSLISRVVSMAPPASPSWLTEGPELLTLVLYGPAGNGSRDSAAASSHHCEAVASRDERIPLAGAAAAKRKRPPTWLVQRCDLHHRPIRNNNEPHAYCWRQKHTHRLWCNSSYIPIIRSWHPFHIHCVAESAMSSAVDGSLDDAE